LHAERVILAQAHAGVGVLVDRHGADGGIGIDRLLAGLEWIGHRRDQFGSNRAIAVADFIAGLPGDAGLGIDLPGRGGPVLVVHVQRAVHPAYGIGASAGFGDSVRADADANLVAAGNLAAAIEVLDDLSV